MTKTALISGVSGQTGSLLARRLLEEGYRVIGGSRDVSSTDWWRLQILGIAGDVELISLAPSDFHSVFTALKGKAPEEVYFLAGQSSVALSFGQPFEAFESIAVGTLNFLEALRVLGLPTRFFNAASTDCFGDQSGIQLSEVSAMKPISPYGVAKATSFWTTVNYRQSFGLHASNGILSNHESGLRGKAFVTQKIIGALLAKKRSPSLVLELGNTSIRRDWVWAQDVVNAIRQIVLAPEPEDYIVATGTSYSLEQFVTEVCRHIDIDPRGAYTVSPSLLRPNEIQSVELDPSRIHTSLGWSHSVDFEDLVLKLVEEFESSSRSLS